MFKWKKNISEIHCLEERNRLMSEELRRLRSMLLDAPRDCTPGGWCATCKYGHKENDPDYTITTYKCKRSKCEHYEAVEEVRG